MAQPNVTLKDYFGGKSIVLRSVPEDYFRQYSEFLTGLTGKWNPNLKDPSGTGTLPGWIFPKKNEAQVNQGIAQILSGQIQPQPVVYRPSTLSQGQAQTLTSLGVQQPFYQTQQPTNTLQQLLSAAQARNMSQPTPAGGQSPIFSLSTPVGALPPSNVLAPTPQLLTGIPPGYQQVTYIVIKPESGGTLYLTVGQQKIPVKVESVENHNGVTNRAIIQLPDGNRTYIQLENDRWTIPKYEQPHTISLQ